ncbi:hypothetical protein [Micromonospora sp. NPDC004551]|uniref:hypothetical protein n=1 Tax=Micromonospora sp. NPDC004551 TaxID=3154284 RepID=UPI0033B7050D
MTDTQPRPSASIPHAVLAAVVTHLLMLIWLVSSLAGYSLFGGAWTAALALFLSVSMTRHVLDRLKERLPARVNRINDLLGKALVVIFAGWVGLFLATLMF